MVSAHLGAAQTREEEAMKRLRRIGMPASLLMACIFGACVFGTGTDTENGVTDLTPPNPFAISAQIVDSLGKPVANVELHAHSLLFRPDLFRPDLGISDSVIVDSILPSDSLGKTHMRFYQPGTFVVEGRALGKTLFFDTVKVDSGVYAPTQLWVAQPSSNLQGFVRMASDFKVDSGWVFVRGTERLARIQSDGSYDLGFLPKAVGGMTLGVRYAARPKDTLVVVASNNSASDSLKAASPLGSNATCLDSATAATITPNNSPGSTPPTDSALANTARTACAGQVGVVVQVRYVDGVSQSPTANDYVLLGPNATPNVNAGATPSYAVPATCVASGNEMLSYQTTLTSLGDIRVNDVAAVPACQFP